MNSAYTGKLISAPIKRLGSNSLFHFVIGGVLIAAVGFLVDGWRERDEYTIELSLAEERVLIDRYEQAFGRTPNPLKRSAIVEKHLQQEVLFREGLKLGLHLDDLIVRRRVEQKMKDYLASQWEQDISRADLERYYRDHIDVFMAPPEFGFEHQFFSLEERGARAREDAERAVQSLKRGEQPGDTGDDWYLASSQQPRSITAIRSEYGTSFADTLMEQTQGEWVGPMTSGYGHHAVRIVAYLPERPRDFEEVKWLVWSQYLKQLQQVTLSSKLEQIQRRYHVVTESDEKAR